MTRRRLKASESTQFKIQRYMIRAIIKEDSFSYVTLGRCKGLDIIIKKVREGEVIGHKANNASSFG